MSIQALTTKGCYTIGKPITTYLGLGSNLGDRLGNIIQAARRISDAAEEGIFDVSSVYETYPVGGPEQPDFLNAAISLVYDGSPGRLLSLSRSVEDELGRERKVRWGPRTIDIDILLFGDYVIDSGELIIPHPRLHERSFVLVPLAEIAGDVVHPVFGETIRSLRKRIGDEGVRKTAYEIVF